ncbi:MAG: hypothetical protein ACE5IW_11550 [bacterium]
MTQKINLKELERKVWTSYFEDGLWDIFIGIWILTMGMRAITDNVWFSLIALSSVLIGLLGKKFITIPRLGYVKFKPARKAKLDMRYMVVAIAAFISFMILFIVVSKEFYATKGIRAALQGIGLTLMSGLIAHLMHSGRLFIYGLLFAMIMVLWELYGNPVGTILSLITGSAILLIGLVLLTRFLRKYPVRMSEPLSDGGANDNV